jgi:photosystem II stability/assembly factor-like uncharacterized protein
MAQTFPEENSKEEQRIKIKRTSKISGYIIRSAVYAVFLSVALIALSSAFNSSSNWYESAGTTGGFDTAAKIASQPPAMYLGSSKAQAQTGMASAATAQAQTGTQAPLFHPHPVNPWTPRTKPLPPLRAPLLPTIQLSTTTWTALGPAPLNSLDVTDNVSGRLAAVAAHPTDANTIYVAPAGGGVWKTTNGGTNWTALTDIQSTLSMGAIAIARTNPLVVYAGTGEANNSGDSNFGRGILVSTNGGASFTLNTGPGDLFNTNRMTCSRIAGDPTNANVAYAAMADFGNNGVFASGITGVYKTTNGGSTWTNVTMANGKDSTYPWSDVVVDPNTPNIVYAAVGYVFGTANNGVYKSTDSGGTWTLLNAAPVPVGASFGRISIAISKANNANVLYIAAAQTYDDGGALARFVRSDNGGSTFTDLTAGTPNYMGFFGWYATTLLVHPANSSIVYAAGMAGANSMLRSTNSGATWTDISHWGVQVQPHVDHHGIDFDANGKLLDGDDGGIYRLDDPTIPSWSDLNGNLDTIQFEGIGLHPTNANIVIGGSQDNGTELYSGAPLWIETDGGDGGMAQFSPTNGSRVYHQIPFGSFGPNFFRRSDDGGLTWVTKTSGIVVDQNVQNFYAPFAVDPGNGNRVLYGTNRVWETTTAGDSWTPISPVLNTGGNFVDTLAIAPSDTNTVYASTGGTYASSSRIFVTANHGSMWTEHDLPPGSARVNEIQVDPANAQIAYAVVNRFSTAGHVFRTTNGGMNWTNISGTGGGALPNLPVWSIQIDNSTSPSRLYIGAENGVYTSTDLGVNWSRLGTGLPNVQVFQVAFNGSLHILGAATHGRGAWEIQTTAIATPTATATASPTATRTPTPTPTATRTPTSTPTGTPSGTPSCTPTNINQGFDDITNLPGWVMINHSQPLGTTNWFQGNDTVFPAFDGPPTAYIAANFDNGADVATLSNWLLTPVLNLKNGNVLTFYTRTTAVGAQLFPDRLQVRMSTNGASTNVGTTASDVGDFTTLLLDINPTYDDQYPHVWTLFTVTISGVNSPTTGRLAFRYFVEDGGPNGANSNYIGIDRVVYNGPCTGGSPTPTPTATATATHTPTATPTATATATFTPTPTPTATATPSLHPAFFSGEVSLGNGIYYLQFPNGTPFGYYTYLSDPHWIYHFDMGYEYWFDANDANHGIYFYDLTSTHFFYTSPSFPFPYLYDFSFNTVLYYYPDSNNPGHYTTNPRYFYNFATGQIITM